MACCDSERAKITAYCAECHVSNDQECRAGSTCLPSTTIYVCNDEQQGQPFGSSDRLMLLGPNVLSPYVGSGSQEERFARVNASACHSPKKKPWKSSTSQRFFRPLLDADSILISLNSISLPNRSYNSPNSILSALIALPPCAHR